MEVFTRKLDGSLNVQIPQTSCIRAWVRTRFRGISNNTRDIHSDSPRKAAKPAGHPA